jgi:hypothetical protein
MSSSVPSVIRSFFVVLSAVSYVTAQVPLGVQMVPNPEMVNSPVPSPSPSNSYQSVSALPLETGSPTLPAPPSYHTPPPAHSSNVYEKMPYSSFTNGGYSSMDCGYGFKKGSDGKCIPEDWWNSGSWGCYQTTIILNNPQPNCPPPHTVTVTDHSVETKVLTVTHTQPIPTTVLNTVTKTDVKTETLHVTKTETLPLTITATSLVVESKTLTKTDTIKEVRTDVVTKTDIKVIPTTFTSVWVKTDIIDKTNTIERTLTSTVTDKQTLTDTLTYLSTSTKTDVSTQLSVATSTTTQILQETGLSACLSKCDQLKNLQPGNGNQYNTYASPPAHTPSPTAQPYQYQEQGGGYY